MIILSLFPGIDLLGRGFEDEGFCVVRGPDLIFGGDVRKFHPPAGRFDGIIGGPPCQAFSSLRHLVKATGGKIAENLIPEYERCCSEAQPTWFLMENVPDAPEPIVPGYMVHSLLLDNRQCPEEPGGSIGAEQRRVRRFSFGTRDGRVLKPRVALFEAPRRMLTVTGDMRQTPVAIGGSGKRKSTLVPIDTVLASQGKSGASLSERDRAKGGRLERVGDRLAPVPTVLASSGGGVCDAEYNATRWPRVNGGNIRKGASLVPIPNVTANGTTWDPEKQRPRSFRSQTYFREACRLQGLPDGFDLPGFTVQAAIRAVGNGVPYPMSRAIAAAVREAMA